MITGGNAQQVVKKTKVNTNDTKYSVSFTLNVTQRKQTIRGKDSLKKRFYLTL
jgi:hypothetical protein